MKLKNQGWLIWIVLAYLFCLMPSRYFHWFSPLSEGLSKVPALAGGSDLLEWAAHALLMAGVAFCLFRMFRSNRGGLFSLAVTLLLVLLIAVSIEWFQGLLPESFHRGPAISDVWASVVGGLVGALVATVLGRDQKATD
jgi:VanZ family protein